MIFVIEILIIVKSLLFLARKLFLENYFSKKQTSLHLFS